MVLAAPLFRLKGGLQSYEWGKTGSRSAAARYAAATDEEIAQDKSYAELWMGTHPSKPSVETESGYSRKLSEMFDENKMLMGHSVAEKYGDRLPFLFKILSIEKALSIQAHPDKKLAKKLREDDPEHYPDDNHKPEMTIAITPFEGFCGFRPLDQISSFISSVPEFKTILGDSASVFQSTIRGKERTKDEEETKVNKAGLKSIFQSLMTTDEYQLKELAPKLVSRAKSEGNKFAGEHGGSEFAALIERLNSQFSNDIGLFVAFFLNYIKLAPGEAMFLRANDIHAYLSGDIVECMAASDNVVRAGFTPKFKDVKNLVQMLTYSYAPISEQKMTLLKFGRAKAKDATMLYDPPIEEFSVLRTELPQGREEIIQGIKGPSILICTHGEGTLQVGNKKVDAKAGYIYFVGADAELQMEGTSQDTFTSHRAFCEV